MNKLIRKREGFQGQKMIIIPRKILIKSCTNNPAINPLYITDIGYYPKAQFHFIKRANGIDQSILIYCFEGAGKVIIEKNEYKIVAGEYIIIPPKTAHSYVAEEVNPWSIYWVHFTGTASEKIVASYIQTYGVKGFIYNNEKCISLFNDIYSQLERGYGIKDLQYVNMCLWYFLSTFFFNEKQNEKYKLTKKDPIDYSIDYLKQHINKILTLTEIAREINLSIPHFSYLFKKKTGFAPIEYFNHLKIQKACQYLLFTNLRVKEISLELGIEDQHYFSRIFSKVMGISPRQYKNKRYKEESSNLLHNN